MDTRTGNIYPREELTQLFKTEPVLSGRFSAMKIPPTPEQLVRKPIDSPIPVKPIGRVGRNDACPCGSGKKFKYCCRNI
jgi:uncharacterized protein YecA (UPF0149 family)